MRLSWVDMKFELSKYTFGISGRLGRWLLKFFTVTLARIYILNI